MQWLYRTPQIPAGNDEVTPQIPAWDDEVTPQIPAWDDEVTPQLCAKLVVCVWVRLRQSDCNKIRSHQQLASVPGPAFNIGEKRPGTEAKQQHDYYDTSQAPLFSLQDDLLEVVDRRRKQLDLLNALWSDNYPTREVIEQQDMSPPQQ